MEAGPGLDAKVATEIMGWKHVSDSEHWALGWNGSSIADASEQSPVIAYDDFRPSTDIAAAWAVVDKLYDRADLKLTANVGATSSWQAEFMDHIRRVVAHAQTPAHAICEAALKFVEATSSASPSNAGNSTSEK